MRALTVVPGHGRSGRLEETDDPPPTDGALLIRTIAIGVCGTDREIVSGSYGWPPPGSDRLIIGHESIGRVVNAPADSGFAAGDLVAGIVRRPDPIPCACCAVGEWDMCRNGLYTERGIKQRHGYAADCFRLEPAFAVRVSQSLGLLGVFIEPASVVAKAWDHAERIGRRSAAWQPRCALITGAGPIGLLAALLSRQRGLEVHVFDRVTEGQKPHLVRDLGAHYHGGDLTAISALQPDVVFECTGASSVIAGVLTRTGPSGIVCLTGVSSGGHEMSMDIGDTNRRLVLQNDVIFGSVNANRRHYEMAAAALSLADRQWLSRLITRRVQPERWSLAFQAPADDVKAVIEFDAAT
jgi:threonine dehydrogenase-like Zn-dependent dehydrogenase